MFACLLLAVLCFSLVSLSLCVFVLLCFCVSAFLCFCVPVFRSLLVASFVWCLLVRLLLVIAFVVDRESV